MDTRHGPRGVLEGRDAARGQAGRRTPPRRWCALALAVATGLLWQAALGAPVPAFADADGLLPDDPKTIGVAPVYFIQPAPYTLLEEDLVLWGLRGLGHFLSAKQVASMNEIRREHAAKLTLVKTLRDTVAERALDYHEALLNELRLVESVRYSGGKNMPMDMLWAVADKAFGMGGSRRETGYRQMLYYKALYDLQNAEEEMRKKAQAYYEVVLAGFRGVEPRERERLLAWFAIRTDRLDAERLKRFESMEELRRLKWRRLRARLAREGRALLGELWTTKGNSVTAFMDWAVRDRRTDEDVAGDADPARNEAVRAAYSAMRGEWDARMYNWLAAECTTHFLLHSRLLDVHEKARRNTDLFELEAVSVRNRLTEPTEAEKELRLKLFRRRAQRARLHLLKERLAAEATVRHSASILLGLHKICMDTERHRLAINEGTYITSEGFRLIKPLLDHLARAAAGAKVLGDSFSILVTTPLEDGFIELVMKPLAQSLGGDVSTSVEAKWQDHEKKVKEIQQRAAAIQYMLGPMTYEEGMNFVHYLLTWTWENAQEGRTEKEGETRGQSLAMKAPGITRRLLKDTGFINGTQGGLPAMFAILPCRSRERRGLHIHGAAFALEANISAGALRLAVSRGKTIADADLKTMHKLVDEVLGREQAGAALTASDLFFKVLPFARAAKDLWELPQNVRNAVRSFGGDIGDQDEYIERQRVLYDILTHVASDLRGADYDFFRLRTQKPGRFRQHCELLAECGEYVSAVLHAQSDYVHVTKLAADMGERGQDGTLSSLAAGRLAGMQKSWDRECSQLALRAAELKLLYHTTTTNYGAAATQCREQQKIWNNYLEERGDPRRADLEPLAKQLEGLVANEEFVQAYEGIYRAALKEMCFSIATTALTNAGMNQITRRFGKVYLRRQAADDVMMKLMGAFNPWVGKFSADGVFGTLESSFQNAFIKGFAENVASSGMVDKTTVEGIADAILSIGVGTMKNVHANVRHADLEWTLAETDYDKRDAAARAARADLDRVFKGTIGPALTDFEAAATPAARKERAERILQTAEGLLNDPTFRLAQGRFEIANEAYRMAQWRRDRARREAEASARHTIGALHKEDARERRKGAKPDSPQALSADIEESYGVLLQRLSEPDKIDLAVAKHLSDPEILKHFVFRNGGISIETIRETLKAAIRNEPDREAEIRAAGAAIDAHRRAVVDGLLHEFMTRRVKVQGEDGEVTERHVAEGVEMIIQVGASHGNPEYQGVFGDIDLTVLTDPDANVDLVRLKQDLLDFYAEKGILLATPEQDSTMDTEVFTQPMHSSEADTFEFEDLVTDVDRNRADATRFGSRGMDAWIKNSMAFSGRIITDAEGKRLPWRKLKPEDGYGASVEMSCYLGGILTDPDLEPATFKALSPAEKHEVLTHVYEKSKYFVRLSDTYVVSHERGNELYNARQGDCNQNLSLHDRIAQDFAKIAGEGHAFSKTDAENLAVLAKMKLKADNPDLWAVIEAKARAGDEPRIREGASADEVRAGRIEEAWELYKWMRATCPRMIAEAAHVHREAHRRALEAGDQVALARFQEDGLRTGGQILNFAQRKPPGAAAAVVPPRGEGPDVRASHIKSIEEQLDATRARRAKIREIADRPYAAVRSQFRRDQPLDERAYERIQTLLSQENQAVSAAATQSQFAHEAQAGDAMRYWMTLGMPSRRGNE